MNKLIRAAAFSFVSFVLFLSAAVGQEIPKSINGGVLNGKAVSLPKPPYPAAARQANASGAVSVKVTIDEEGNVTNAEAVSGHPLLRAAAVEAATQAKFSPTRLSGQPVKVSGTIVYNFMTTPPAGAMRDSWYDLGNMIAGLDHIPTLRFYQPQMIAAMIPVDWVEEQAQIKRLDAIRTAELEGGAAEKPVERIISETPPDAKNGRVGMTVINSSASPGQKASPEARAIGQSLISSIRGRLGSQPVDLWKFDLGVAFCRALLDADSRQADKRSAGVDPFRDFVKNAPPDISPDLIAELNVMADAMEKGIFTDEDKIKMSRSMTKINVLLSNR